MTRLAFASFMFVCIGIVGCTANEQPEEAVLSSVQYLAEHNMQETMALVMEPVADKVWDSAGYVLTAEGEVDLAPTTDEGWAEVVAATAVLIESSNLLLLPDRIVDERDWIEYVNRLGVVSVRLKAAAVAQDKDTLFAEGGNLYNVCRACHQQYWKQDKAF